MFVLLIQLGYSLFFSGQAAEELSSIDVIVRTSTASIFGYFLSANFIKHKPPSVNQQSKSSGSAEINIAEHTESEDDVEAIVENKMQIIIATAMGLFCLISLLFLRNIADLNPDFASSSSTAATIAQFRDFVSGCVGFLIGCPSKN